MKRLILIAVSCILLLSILPGCDVLYALEITPTLTPTLSPTPILTPSPSPYPSLPPPSGEVIVFKDPIVEKVISTTLNKPEGPVTDHDMLKVLNFKFDYTQVKAFGGTIKTLDDLRWCVNLQHFVVSDTNITDISALSGSRDLVEFQYTNKLNNYTPLLANKNLNTILLSGVTESFFRELMGNCSFLEMVALD